jgi:NADH:ubiquinone oxidoreductase subunit K
VLLLLADIPFDALTPHFAGAAEAVPFIPFACVGCVVARSQPRNVIGWLLIGVGFAMGAAYTAGPYAVLAFRDGHPGLPLARIASVLTAGWALLLALLPLPILLFPEGRLPSPRWRWPLRVYLVLAALVFAVSIAGDIPALYNRTVHVDTLGELAKATSAGFGTGGVPAAALFFVAYAILSLSFIGRQVLGFRRASGDHRKQLKWLLSGASLAVAGAIATVTLSHASSPVVSVLAALGYLAVAALPAAIGVGVLRYRLYDIDRLISRTLSYAILTGLLVGMFIGVVALTTDVLPLSSRVGVAASTLAAAALFNPLRKRIQHLVDRRFNRTRYDAEATVAAFTTRLRDAVEIDSIRADLLDAVNRAVQPTHASVWIRP